jgi:hypothetical protein
MQIIILLLQFSQRNGTEQGHDLVLMICIVFGLLSYERTANVSLLLLSSAVEDFVSFMTSSSSVANTLFGAGYFFL